MIKLLLLVTGLGGIVWHLHNKVYSNISEYNRKMKDLRKEKENE